VFVAGDAAHQQPPFLGQGMCQGIRDVANLNWKLAAVLRQAMTDARADALLDSYGIERKQHVRSLTSRIKAIGAVICERDEARARARDAHLLDECGGTVRDMPRQEVIPPLEQGLLAHAGTPARGTLFPQPWIRQAGTAVHLDQMAGDGWWLVLDTRHAGAVPALPSEWGMATLDLGELAETEGVCAAWFERHRCTAAVVRPDRYVYGVASDARELDALLDELRNALH